MHNQYEINILFFFWTSKLTNILLMIIWQSTGKATDWQIKEPAWEWRTLTLPPYWLKPNNNIQ